MMAAPNTTSTLVYIISFPQPFGNLLSCVLKFELCCGRTGWNDKPLRKPGAGAGALRLRLSLTTPRERECALNASKRGWPLVGRSNNPMRPGRAAQGLPGHRADQILLPFSPLVTHPPTERHFQTQGRLRAAKSLSGRDALPLATQGQERQRHTPCTLLQ